MRTRFALGLFDPSETVRQAQVPDSEMDNPSHRQLALKLARESMVLLNNDGTRLVGTGKYSITVARGQPGATAAAVTASFEIQGEQNLPR